MTIFSTTREVGRCASGRISGERARPIAGPARGTVLIAMAALVAGLLYLSLPSRNAIYADDSLRFLLQVHDGGSVNVHHLILLLLHWADRLAQGDPAGLSATGTLFQGYVAAGAMLALWLVGSLSLRWFGSLRIALATIGSVAFSYGFWSYATVTDLYVPAIAFLLLAIWFAEKGSAVATSFSLLAASLNHQSHALAVVPIVVVLWFMPGDRRGAIGSRRSARVVMATTALLGLVCFGGAMRLAGETDAARFVRGYSAYMNLTPYDRLQPLTPIYAAVGITRAIVHPEYALRFDAIFAWVEREFPLKVVFDDRYAIRGLPVWMIVGAGALSIAVMGLVLAGVAGAIRHAGSPPSGYRMLLGTGVVQTLFFGWWEPSSNEFWIWLVPTLALLVIGPALRSAPNRARLLAWALPGMLLAANLPVVSRYWSGENDVYSVNKRYLADLPSEALVISANLYQSSSIDRASRCAARRFDVPLGSFDMRDPRLRIELELLGMRGGALYLDPMLAMPERSEMALMGYYRGCSSAGVARELRRLEEYCRRRAIPLFAIVREGAGSGEYLTRGFGGYLRWIDSRQLRESPSPGHLQASGRNVRKGLY